MRCADGRGSSRAVRCEVDPVAAWAQRICAATDEQFAGLFPARGERAWSPGWQALVVLHFVENLTDRQAAEVVRARIDWKYALGLD